MPLATPFSGPRSTNFKGFHVGLWVTPKGPQVQADEAGWVWRRFVREGGLAFTLPSGPSGGELI